MTLLRSSRGSLRWYRCCAFLDPPPLLNRPREEEGERDDVHFLRLLLLLLTTTRTSSRNTERCRWITSASGERTRRRRRRRSLRLYDTRTDGRPIRVLKSETKRPKRAPREREHVSMFARVRENDRVRHGVHREQNSADAPSVRSIFTRRD